ncbi:ER degradation enhancer, mannosidase alpha-like 1, glycoside hydrolase family 47 protein [Rhodotorula toruloides]|uniref:alpha-1,2-Mannosidase n=1 Tax=Rhodotorula toruloides TaxID=5286 RepID=A0A511KP90_RHOTO|nr:ER degradation enhancer, mannosidase alpha-like 1, glycoside hydrolase family 47 protein [Rhodotorula toruloides]
MAAETWRHAYNSYKRVAFPADELLPLSCGKQGHDRANPNNAGVNDVMGDYALTLVDSLDTFAMLNDKEGFEQAVRETIEHVSFDVDSRVQVFEVTIRMMGGLLSGHLLAMPDTYFNRSDPSTFHSSVRGFSLPWYRSELLHLAHDLGRRLLPAFETPTGIPFARACLHSHSTDLEPAGAGSLLLEFITLSRLTSDPTYETLARRAFFAIWDRRSDIGLIGNTIDARSGVWMHGAAGTGAGIDSFYEYAAKAYVLTGDQDYLRVWEDGYAALQRYVRTGDGFWYRGANMLTGQLTSVLVDSLAAFMPGVQTLMGDLDSATRSHAPYAFLWLRYGGVPELYDTHRRQGVHLGYPLRPEYIESNMYLYQATKDDWYLELAEQVLHDINNKTRVSCGFAAILNLDTGKLEDKMPSFVTSETLKYLYLTFDEDSPFLRDDSAFVFTTEGHPLEIPHPPPDSPSSSSRTSPPNSTSASAPTCAAHEPVYDQRHAHFLSLSMNQRVDWEHARWLAGYQPQDEQCEVDGGRWSRNGWCEMPLGEDPVVTSARFVDPLQSIRALVLHYLRSAASVTSNILPGLAPSARSVSSTPLADAPPSDQSIELLFAPSTSHEILRPLASQLTPHPTGSGDIIVNSINGLRFTLVRASTGGSAGYVVSKVGPLLVPPGRSVVIRDQAVLAGLPQKKPDRIALRAVLGGDEAPALSGISEEGRGAEEKPMGRLDAIWDALVPPLCGSAATNECSDSNANTADDRVPTSLHIPALAASFGPSILHRPSSAIPSGLTPFMLDGPPLPLVVPSFDPYGCSPLAPPPSTPALALLRRGHCSFALKSHNAALSSYAGVVLLSSPLPSDSDEQGDGFVVPSADESEEGDKVMKSLVPLVLVANSTGVGLEGLVRSVHARGGGNDVGEQAEARLVVQVDEPSLTTTTTKAARRVVWVSITHAEEDEEEEEGAGAGLLLGGYLVRNIKLHRTSRPPAAAGAGGVP